MKKADLRVIQAPVNVIFECPHCEVESEFEYVEFCGMIGLDPCDWLYSKFTCPECEKDFEIDDVDWD